MITYTFGGFAGALVAGEPPSFTLITLGQRFFEDGIAGTSNLAGVWIVTVGFFAFTLMLPPLQLLACCAHASSLGGTSRRAQTIARWSYAVAALLATWCALDIFLIGCLAAMFELGALTSTIGDMLCADFQWLVPAGEDCFRSDGQIQSGFWVLAAACGLWLLVNCIALCSCGACKQRSRLPGPAAGDDGDTRVMDAPPPPTCLDIGAVGDIASTDGDGHDEMGGLACGKHPALVPWSSEQEARSRKYSTSWDDNEANRWAMAKAGYRPLGGGGPGSRFNPRQTR